MPRKPYKAHMNTLVEWDREGIEQTTIRDLHEEGRLEAVCKIDLYNRVRPEYAAVVALFRDEEGRVDGTAYYPIYKHTYEELRRTGKYDLATGERIKDA